MQLHSLILTSSQQRWLIHHIHIYSPDHIHRRHLQPIGLALPFLHNMRWLVRLLPTYFMWDLFINPFLCAFCHSLSCTFELFPPNPIIQNGPASLASSSRLQRENWGLAVCFQLMSKWTDSQRERRGEREETQRRDVIHQQLDKESEIGRREKRLITAEMTLSSLNQITAACLLTTTVSPLLLFYVAKRYI